MDKTRILPPQVRGRVTGVLDFFVDEIRLFRNILMLTDNFDLVLQVQWWGEVLPAFIRPKEIYVEGKTRRKSHTLESYYHSAQYEIKTTLDLFKSYLKNCEVLELSVLEAFENYIIGSAFLRDLINVLNNNNESVRMPIFDYLGEEIGEVIIHVSFLQKPHQDKDKIQSKSNVIYKNNYVSKISDKQENVTSKINLNSFSLAEKTIFYDGHSKKNPTESIIEAGLPKHSYDFRINEKTNNSNLSSTVSDTSNKLLNSQDSRISNKLVGGDKESTCACLPEIETVNDASRVLYFGGTSQQSRHKTDSKKPKITNKFNSNSIKFKSKHPERLCSLPSVKSCRKSLTKKAELSKNLTKNPSKTKKEKEFDLKVSSTSSEFVTSEIHTLNEPTDLENIPSKQSPNTKVLDYLFGSDMSKDDEQIALNDLKRMSPSHNLVDSINKLCLASDEDKQKSSNRGTNSPAPEKQNLLNFDFNNPIERNYYERFFLKTNSSPDFEFAELLNQPENSFILSKFDETALLKNESQISNLKSANKFAKEVKEAKHCLGNVCLPNRRNSCARCKYYKKLSELDTIIESLKHFEQKMRSQEKDLQSSFKENSDLLIKRNHY